MNKVYTQMFEANCRIDKMFWLPGTVADAEGTPSDFRDFCDDLPDAGSILYKQLPVLAQFADEDYDLPSDPETVASLLFGLPGFILQISTPVLQSLGSGRHHYSWGYTHYEWLYVASENDIPDVAFKWAEECRARDRKEVA